MLSNRFMSCRSIERVFPPPDSFRTRRRFLHEKGAPKWVVPLNYGSEFTGLQGRQPMQTEVKIKTADFTHQLSEKCNSVLQDSTIYHTSG